MTKQTLPYGSWPSPINSELMSRGSVQHAAPTVNDLGFFWQESRPQQKGRNVIVWQDHQGQRQEIIPPGSSNSQEPEESQESQESADSTGFNVRTRAHEYGGIAWLVDANTLYFVNDSDQRVYAYHFTTAGVKPVPLSPEGNASTHKYRFADFCIDHQRQQLIAVCEIHREAKEPKNCIIALPLDGSGVDGFKMLVFGNDFYSNPRLSPDGQMLSWLTWNHPFMPWDNSECYLAEFNPMGLLHKERKVAGGYTFKEESGNKDTREESIFQPQWSPMGELYFVSDRTGWWNIYRYNTTTKLCQLVVDMDAEFGLPQWQFGMSSYGFLNSFTLFCCYTQNGRSHGALVDTLTKQLTPIDLPFTAMEAVACDDHRDTAVFMAANETGTPAIVSWHKHQHHILAKDDSLRLHTDAIAHPEGIHFNNAQGLKVHGFFYPPTHCSVQGPEDSLPPMVVICHGGPTTCTRPIFSLKVQYWTSRGFAVFDINYSGSTGYGRAYRDRLKKQWGVADVEDICAGAQHMIDSGRVNPDQVIVRGSSAGGYSVLAALTFRDTFKAGASLYGIGDLSLLAEDTHKFESRYLDQLVGEYPKDKVVYEQRSPVKHAERLRCPVIFLQGLEDKIVPPNQAETMVKALVENKVDVAYVTYPEEGHGFRQAATIQHSLAVEYGFYAKVFGFEANEPESIPEIPFYHQGKTE